MRKYAAHSVALIFAVASFVTGASGCSKVQSKGANDSAQTSQSSGAMSRDQSAQSVEGCVIKRETAYYIQPATGDAVKVSSSGQDVSSNVGQHVRATGTASTGTPSSAGAAGTGAGTSGSQSSSGATGGSSEPELVVTKVDVVESNCPPEMQKKGKSQSPNPNPK